VGTRFGSFYCNSAFGCAKRNHAFDVRGIPSGGLKVSMNMGITLAATLSTYNYLDKDWSAESFTVLDLEWHNGYLYVLCNDGKLYRRDGYNSYTNVVTTPGLPAGYLGRLMSYDGDLFVAAKKSAGSGGQAAVYRLNGSSLSLEVESAFSDQRPLYNGGSYLFWQNFTLDGDMKYWARRDSAGSWTWGVGPDGYAYTGQRALFADKRLAGYQYYYDQGTTISRSSIGGSTFPMSGLRSGSFDSKLWMPFMYSSGSWYYDKLCYLSTWAGGWTATAGFGSTYNFQSCVSGSTFLAILGTKAVGGTPYFAAFHYDGSTLSTYYLSSEASPSLVDHVADDTGAWLYVATSKKIYRLPPP